MKIMLIKSSHVIGSAGGAEKVFCDMANALSKKGHQIIALTEDKKQGLPFFPLDTPVDFRNLAKRWFYFLPRFFRLFMMKPLYASVIKAEKPDCIIAFFFNDIKRLPTICPIILMQHSVPGVYFKSKYDTHYKKLFKKANAVQVLMPSFMFDIMNLMPHLNVQCIPNAVIPCLPENKATLSQEKKVILSVGRLEHEKGTHLLINAMGYLQKEFPDWQLHLYGKYSKKEYQRACEQLIQKMGLENTVKIFTPTQDILSKYKTADIASFPSLYEGFSLALTEAMASGLPVISMEYSRGSNEIIKNGHNGLLGKNKETGLQEALACLMRDKSLRQRLGKNAAEDMKQYDPDKVWAQWEDLIQSTAHS